MGIFGFLSLLGELGITSIGREVYSLLKYPLGEMAWFGPFVFFILAFAGWVSSSFQARNQGVKVGKARIEGKRYEKPRPKVKTKHEERVKSRSTKKSVHSSKVEFQSLPPFESGVVLPKSKLVNLKGFNEYFSSSEGPEIGSADPLEELEDIGKDFPTYFKEGSEFSFKPLGTRLAPIRGFSGYFDEVSAELEEELKKIARPDVGRLFPPKREWETPAPMDSAVDNLKGYPGQVAQLLKLERKDTVGVSPEERAELLGKPKVAQPIVNWGVEIVEAVELEMAKGKVLDAAEIVTSETVASEFVTSEIVASVETIEVTQLETIETVEIEEDLDTNTSVVAITRDPSVQVNASSSERSSSAELLEVGSPAKDEQVREGRTECLDKPVAWKLPKVELLDTLPQIPLIQDSETQTHLERVLEDFGVHAKVIRVARGPVITRYELAPAPGVKISRIVNLADDIALGLAARDVRIEAPIPGKAAIGIEVPNKQPRPVHFREVLETPEYKENSSKLRIALGKDIANQSVVANLAKMPHLLVAGATGSGKSVCITALINSLLFNARPDEVKFLMVDPKMVELSIYNGIPHLLAPVVTDPKKAAAALKWVVKEMETRYELFAASGVRDIERYNRLKAEVHGKGQGEMAPALPWIIVIIDELADLMMVAADEVEEAICRLAQMARAAGIHLVIATQRPSVDVITGVIKANIPSRISFAVSSQIDSRTILDATGAEKLLGRGDMLYSPQGLNKPVRVQGCMVSDEEVQRIISFWKAQGRPEYLDPEGFTSVASAGKTEGSGIDDELFVDAGRLILTMGVASVSYLQRKLKIGYARAARLMDLLEENGIVGGYEGSKARQILITIEEFEERFG